MPVGRCLPLIRSIVSVLAGLTGMPLWRFTLLTVAGSGSLNGLFIYLGYRLQENYTAVERYAAPISRQWLPWHCSRWCGWPFAESASAGGAARTPLRSPSKRPHRPRAATADHPAAARR